MCSSEMKLLPKHVFTMPCLFRSVFDSSNISTNNLFTHATLRHTNNKKASVSRINHSKKITRIKKRFQNMTDGSALRKGAVECVADDLQCKF